MRYLLVIDKGGNVALADSETGVRMPIGEPLTPTQRSQVTGAAWSAAGEWTAWSIDSDSPDGVHELRLHEEETDRSSVLADGVSAFYLCPSPCGRWLSHLSPGPLGLELALSEVLTGDLRILERGQPMFWSWAPDSSQLAIHVENRVVVAAVDGSSVQTLSGDAGSFVAPWWLPGGSVAYVVEDRIVVTTPTETAPPGVEGPAVDGEMMAATLVDGGTTGRFAPDPEGRRIAHIRTVDGEPRLVVVDLLTGGEQMVTAERVGGFFWSPDGSGLAALIGTGSGKVQWVVFDGVRSRTLPPFRPSRSWVGTVLGFFEQYAQSHSHWSGDSGRLVAPAVDDDGMSGAFIQSIVPPHESQWIADAELAWWA